MANKQKNKGKSYERAICKHLSSVFGLNFERIPNSGAFTGGKNFYRSDKLSAEQLLLTDGDLIVPSELSHLVFECKNHKVLSFPSFFTGSAKLDEWITQAKSSKRLCWFLVFHVNNTGEFIIFDSKFFNTFKLSHNYMLYDKSYIITTIKDFFEDNKDILLNLPSLNIPL
jgi:hypothetical protein